MSGAHIHQRLFSSDLRELPVRAGMFRSVFLVHVIDDLSFDASVAFAELGRVIRKGGWLIFSSVSDAYGALGYEAFRGLIPLRRRSFDRYKKIRYGAVQILGREALAQRLASAGFAVERYTEFLPVGLSPAWDLGMTVEMAGTRTLSSWLPAALRQHYHRIMLRRLTGALTVEGSRGLNCFVIARRL